MIFLTDVYVTRMHGCWNKYGVVEDLNGELEQELDGVGGYSELARAACDTAFYGLCSDKHDLDGILVVQYGNTTGYRMRIFNPDGSEAEMCGNGIRIFARYLYDNGMLYELKFPVEVHDGKRKVVPEINLNNEGEFESATVDMKKGKLLGKHPISIDGHVFRGCSVSIGNPHYVIFTDKASEQMARKYGPRIEKHPDFQNRTNVEFAKVIFDDSDSWIDLYVWERGAGFTQACGTGACATAFAAYKEGMIKSKTRVALPGGTLDISITKSDSIKMTGPADYLPDDKSIIHDVRNYVDEYKQIPEKIRNGM